VGKDTIAARLVEHCPELSLSRSWTTRARRPGEAEDAYHFVDRATFEERAEADGFLEWVEYMGNLYGTPAPEDEGRDTILVIDVQGAAKVLDSDANARMILVVPPSRDVQEARMRSRGDDEEHVAKRLAGAEQELAEGRRLAHHVVVNDDLARAVEEVTGIIGRYRSAPNG
jgi:guanylate kinase